MTTSLLLFEKMCIFIFLNVSVNEDVNMSLSVFYNWCVDADVDNSWFRALSVLMLLGR